MTLTDYCKNGREAEGLRTLYHPECVSVEAMDYGGHGREAKGIEAIQGKHEWWANTHDVHSSGVEGPFMFEPDRFAIIFEMDVTVKQSGERMQAKEVGFYTVSEGKIIREEFFYGEC